MTDEAGIREYTKEELQDMSPEEVERVFIETKKAEGSPITLDLKYHDTDGNPLDGVADTTPSQYKAAEEQPTEVNQTIEFDDGTQVIENDTPQLQLPIPSASNLPATPEKFTFEQDGKQYTVTSEEIVQQYPELFARAKELTTLKGKGNSGRKVLDILRQGEVSDEDLNLLIDVNRGNKQAIAELLRRRNIEAVDLVDGLEEAEGYKPTEYGKTKEQYELEDAISAISKDAEFDKTNYVLSETWDRDSQEMAATNPEVIKLLHNDMKNGMYDKISPIADKIKVLDGGRQSDIDYYGMAALRYKQEAEQDHVAKVQYLQQNNLLSKIRQAKEAAARSYSTRLANWNAQAQARAAQEQARLDDLARRNATIPSGEAFDVERSSQRLPDRKAYEEWRKALDARI